MSTFVTRIPKAGAYLTALLCFAFGAADRLSTPAARAAPIKSPPASVDPTKMFPDGTEHDFGAIVRGPNVNHVFRIVNTTSEPLQILSLIRA